jgi:hypothetical protein
MIGQRTERQHVTGKGSAALPRLILRDQEPELGISKRGFAGQRQGQGGSQTFALQQRISGEEVLDTSLNVLESILVGLVGANLGLAVQGPVGGVMGGLNGVISGAKQIYNWKSWTGWAAFALDSSWGLIGTELGILLHTVNLFYGSDRKYRNDLSFRQNRHVYDGGFGFSGFAMTQGNVTSNLFSGGGSVATATAALTATGSVQSVTIKNGGSGYDSVAVPTVTFSAPPDPGVRATGTAVVTGGKVVSVTITDPGSGYSTAPTITFSATELLNHESLHILQNRIFGPIYVATYGAWLIIGGVIGGIVGIFVSQDWTTSVEDVAYYDNLWETWAYKVEGPDPDSHHGGDLSWS